MHLLGCRGMLRVKWTFNRTSAVKYSFNGQPNTPSFCLVKKHDLKRFKVLQFYFLNFRWSPMYIAKIGACIVIKW